MSKSPHTTQSPLNSHIATALFIIFSGGMLTAFGRFAPFLIFGAMISAVGAGLLYSLDVGSSTGTWIGFQVLAGVGIGSCFQVPIMVGQALAAPEDIATVTAILMCKSHSVPSCQPIYPSSLLTNPYIFFSPPQTPTL